MSKREDIELIDPVVELKSEFMAMVAEFDADGVNVIEGVGSIVKDDFEDSVRRAGDHALGVGLPDGWVPASTYWLVCGGRIVGTCNLRHRLNDFLESYGGHIGYSVRPSERRKGYGTTMLGLSLEKARGLGLERVLVTCDDDNAGSAGVIEKNGGRLADRVKTEYSEGLIRRYWIELGR